MDISSFRFGVPFALHTVVVFPVSHRPEDPVVHGFAFQQHGRPSVRQRDGARAVGLQFIIANLNPVWSPSPSPGVWNPLVAANAPSCQSVWILAVYLSQDSYQATATPPPYTSKIYALAPTAT